MGPARMRLSDIIASREGQILAQWKDELKKSGSAAQGMIDDSELQEQCRQFLALVQEATKSRDFTGAEASEWDETRSFLNSISRSRARQGFTPSQTATFVLSFKCPLFDAIRDEDPKNAAEQLWTATEIIDELALYTTEVFLKSREEVIMRQQDEMVELSTPVVSLWKGVLALPLIGTLDSARTQVVMETLLQRIVETGSEIAIIDITGVPTVDTLVAQHLMKTVAAARLMGADCIISGIRPQIAQTIVHLGIGLNDVVTKASLATALATALDRTGFAIMRNKGDHTSKTAPPQA
jgi:rsbT co-antagonist protein RsbR